MYYYGIDIGGTTIKCGLFEENGHLLKVNEIPTRKEECGKYILPDIADYIEKNNLEFGLKKEDIAGVGLGVPGSVTDDGVVNKCINLGWGVVNVSKEFTKLTGIPSKVGNDANMAALGEYYKGSGKNYKSMVFVTIGTGVGGGIIIDGKPLNGVNGAACEIVHLPIVKEDVGQCNCGKRGCLEQVASATGIVRKARKLIARKDLTAKDVFDLAKAGDKQCIEAINYSLSYLAKGLACISCAIDPEVYVIGGGVSKAGDYLIDIVSDYYKKDAFHPSRDTKIVLASLGNDAGMYGAAFLAGCMTLN
jgi:glucokinase